MVEQENSLEHDRHGERRQTAVAREWIDEIVADLQRFVKIARQPTTSISREDWEWFSDHPLSSEMNAAEVCEKVVGIVTEFRMKKLNLEEVDTAAIDSTPPQTGETP